MAITESDYAGSFLIPAPKGINQAAGDTNLSLEYAARAHNICVRQGMLAASPGISRAFPSLGAPIGTLTRFYRRTKPDDPEIFVAAAGGALYTYTQGSEGWVLRADGFASDVWSAVTYETAEDGATVDILILSNAQDGMVVVFGSDLRVERKALSIGDDYAGVKFAALGRYAERIFGTGAPGYPDSVFYSRPYDPLDWTDVPETPELGGGVVSQPTWDGDSFIALENFGGCLLAIRERSVFEIRGTDPGTFTITQAFGTDGPMHRNTIVTDMQRMYFLTKSGLGVYDGAALQPLARDALIETMRLAMQEQKNATACVCDHVVYIALAVREREGDVVTENNCIIEYDTLRGAFMLRKGIRVKDFYALGGQVFFTRADAPYDVLRLDDPAAQGFLGEPMESLWQTAWLDLGKAEKKRDFVLRFTAEAEENDVPLELTILTDRREKTKTVRLQRRRRDYRVKIQSSGVRVQLRIRSNARAARWRIFGGIQVDYTTDEV